MVPDHAHPRIRGGEDRIDNRLPACTACNSAKGWLDVTEFRFVKGIRAHDLNYCFPGDIALRESVGRDWLCVYSEEEQRRLFVHNFPWAADAYMRGKSLKKREFEAAKRRGVSRL